VYGELQGQSTDPEHLAIYSEANIYVSDRDNNNIKNIFSILD
jgi:hypothetical protein